MWVGRKLLLVLGDVHVEHGTNYASTSDGVVELHHVVAVFDLVFAVLVAAVIVLVLSLLLVVLLLNELLLEVLLLLLGLLT